MKKQFVVAGAAMCIMVAPGLQARSYSNPFDEVFASMEECARTMAQHMQELPTIFTTGKSSDSIPYPKLSKDDSSVYITLNAQGYNEDSIKKDKKGNYITIELPQENGTLSMKIKEKYYSFEFKKEAKEESTENNRIAQFISYGSSQVTQELPAPVKFDSIQAEYDSQKKELVITLGRLRPKETEIIPITKK